MMIIIGGTGFIGKHLSIVLHKSNINSLSVSRSPDIKFLKENSPSSRAANISTLVDEINVDDIQSAKTVVYLASNSVPSSSGTCIDSEWELNIKPATETISKILSINPKIRVIYLSSGGTVYGPNHSSPISENNQLIPATPYAYGKIAIENYLKLLAETSSLSYTILRASNPVGHWHKNSKQGFINAAISNIKTGKPITIFGDGENVRDYVDVDEICNAIILISKNSKQSKNKTWNIGSGIGSSLNQIILELGALTNSQITVTRLPKRKSDLEYNVLDCTSISRELGWKSELNLTDIIKKSWDNFHF